MPELPDVEALRAAVERECLGRRLLRAGLKEQGGGPRHGLYDDLVLDKAAEASVRRAMEGKVLVGTGRQGKHLWLVLEEGPSDKGKSKKGKAQPTQPTQQQHVLFHMGMTGSLVVKGKHVPQYKAFSISAASWPPKFTKAEFVFEGGVHLAYCDPRRWGRITLKADALSTPPVSELAPDAWKALPDLATFTGALQGCGLPIKALLLDQNKLVSGVGNWVADEILYQARVDPAKRCSALRHDEIAAIRTQTFEVCDIACKANADAAAFPPGWLFHHRWANKAKGHKLPNGAAVVFETIGGRTTAIVPSVQRARGQAPEQAGAGVEGEEGKEKEEKAGGRKRKTAAAPAARVKEEEEDGKGEEGTRGRKRKRGKPSESEGEGRRTSARVGKGEKK